MTLAGSSEVLVCRCLSVPAVCLDPRKAVPSRGGVTALCPELTRCSQHFGAECLPCAGHRGVPIKETWSFYNLSTARPFSIGGAERRLWFCPRGGGGRRTGLILHWGLEGDVGFDPEEKAEDLRGRGNKQARTRGPNDAGTGDHWRFAEWGIMA